MTAIEEETVSTTIPRGDEVQVVGGGKTFRFSKGRIVSGRDDDQSLKEVKSIIGRITRIGIHEGKTKDQYQKPYKQIECDITTADGEVFLKAGLLNENFETRVSQAALTFAWGLTLPFVQEGGIVHISASQGQPWTDEMGRAREASTYVNWAEVKDGKAYPHRRPSADKNAPKTTSEQKFEVIVEQLKKSPLWADRPVSREDDEDGTPNTHLSALCQLAAEHGWPTPEQAPADWLKLYAALFNQTDVKASLAQVDDHDWGQTILVLTERGNKGNWTVPKPLQEAAARIAAAQPATNSSALD